MLIEIHRLRVQQLLDEGFEPLIIDTEPSLQGALREVRFPLQKGTYHRDEQVEIQSAYAVLPVEPPIAPETNRSPSRACFVRARPTSVLRKRVGEDGGRWGKLVGVA